MLITFIEAPLLAMIIGHFTRYTKEFSSVATNVFWENVNLPAFMFMAVIVALFMGLMLSADEIITDRKILERESFLRLSRTSYLHSKILVLFLISAIQTFSFVIVGNTILEIKGMLFNYWAILFTVSCTANMIGLNISARLNSVVTAYIVIPFIVVPQLLFSGVLINFDKLNSLITNPSYVPLIGEVMPSKWAYESMAVNQFQGNKFTREFFDIDQTRYNASYQVDYISLIQSKLQELSTFNLVDLSGIIEALEAGRMNDSIYRTAWYAK